MVPYGSFWFLLVPSCSFWFLLFPHGSSWFLMVSHGHFRFLVPYSFSIVPSSSTSWFLIVSYGSSWILVAPFGSSWFVLLPCGSDLVTAQVLPILGALLGSKIVWKAMVSGLGGRTYQTHRVFVGVPPGQYELCRSRGSMYSYMIYLGLKVLSICILWGLSI